MNLKATMILLALLVSCRLSASQKDSLLLVFWNVENFFEPSSPQAPKYWTAKRFYTKCDAIAKTLLLISERQGRIPDVIALAEIENKKVLQRLVSTTALRKLGYTIVHYDSPDRRGIDCALLYRTVLSAENSPLPAAASVLLPSLPPSDPSLSPNAAPLPSSFSLSSSSPETPSLPATALFPSSANSSPAAPLPSSSSSPSFSAPGSSPPEAFSSPATAPPSPESPSPPSVQPLLPLKLLNSQPKHIYQEDGTVLETRDILLAEFQGLSILINHHPSKIGGKSERRLLAMERMRSVVDSLLSNGSPAVLAVGDFNEQLWPDSPHGSLKYNGGWERIDGAFAYGDIEINQEVFYDKLLLTEDKQFGGLKPKRTFIGPRYNGGISDHLPLVVWVKK